MDGWMDKSIDQSGLSVNGVQLAGYFGGPPLLSRTAIYVPRYLDWERKFELCQISPVTRVITPILSPQYVIGLVKMKDGMLYFHRDIYGNSLSKLNLITGEAILAEIIRNRGSLWLELRGCLTVPFVFLYIICIAIVTIPYIIYRTLRDKISGNEE